MLFEKDMDPRCAYCQRGTPLEDGRVMCVKKGIVSASFAHLKDEDFTL